MSNRIPNPAASVRCRVAVARRGVRAYFCGSTGIKCSAYRGGSGVSARSRHTSVDFVDTGTAHAAACWVMAIILPLVFRGGDVLSGAGELARSAGRQARLGARKGMARRSSAVLSRSTARRFGVIRLAGSTDAPHDRLREMMPQRRRQAWDNAAIGCRRRRERSIKKSLIKRRPVPCCADEPATPRGPCRCLAVGLLPGDGSGDFRPWLTCVRGRLRLGALRDPADGRAGRRPAGRRLGQCIRSGSTPGAMPGEAGRLIPGSRFKQASCPACG